MKPAKSIVGICVLATACWAASAQDAGADKDVITIPKAQYQKMLDEHQKLLEEMKEMKAFKSKMEESQKKVAPQQAETEQALDELEKQLKATKQMAKDSFPGSTKMLLTGYGAAGFISQDHGGDRKFEATFNPIFLWKISDRILFEGEMEAELEGHETHLSLELAHLSYIVNDYVTFSAGKFLTPMNYFVERQHMGWVNKLPDKPLGVYDAFLPEAEVGFQLRGGVPVGSSKLGYALYVANAPELNTDPAGEAEQGTLEFNNFDNVGKHFAVGGRVGFLPIPELEFGYGIQAANVAPPGANSVDSLLQSVDLSYVRESTRLKGIVNLKAQWAWSHVGKYAYVDSNNAALPGFSNNRNGGYVQLAYRPTRLENSIVKNLEPVFRFDMLNQGDALAEVDETRYTVGLNYWLAPTTVFKVAYEFDHQTGANADHHNGVFVQFVTGF